MDSDKLQSPLTKDVCQQLSYLELSCLQFMERDKQLQGELRSEIQVIILGLGSCLSFEFPSGDICLDGITILSQRLKPDQVNPDTGNKFWPLKWGTLFSATPVLEVLLYLVAIPER